jgi:hypothetical protein
MARTQHCNPHRLLCHRAQRLHRRALQPRPDRTRWKLGLPLLRRRPLLLPGDFRSFHEGQARNSSSHPPQTMDAIDGKQARATGSSSPLGEVVDHGFDTLNCPLGGMIQASAMGLGHSPYTFLCIMVGCWSMFVVRKRRALDLFSALADPSFLHRRALGRSTSESHATLLFDNPSDVYFEAPARSSWATSMDRPRESSWPSASSPSLACKVHPLTS